MTAYESTTFQDIAFEVPVLETQRLRMRAPSLDDVEAEAEFFATDRSKGVGGPLRRDQVWRGQLTLIAHWLIRGYGFWGVEDRKTGEYYGHVGCWYPEGWPEPEIGWTVMASAEGKGIAFEAAQAARAYAYGPLGWSTAISLILPDNHRSIALAKRMGATFDSMYVHPAHGEVPIYRHPDPKDVR